MAFKVFLVENLKEIAWGKCFGLSLIYKLVFSLYFISHYESKEGDRTDSPLGWKIV